MLQAIRDKVTGWIAYGIIFLISVPFALWGVNSYLGGGEATPAASVNGEEITQGRLDQSYASYRQRLAQLFGGSIPETFGSETMLKEQVLGQLIEEYALRQYAQKRRYRISDIDLNRMIRAMEVFQRDGQFDVSIYQAQLSSEGYSAQGFEEELRRSQSMSQIQRGIVATSFTVETSEKQFIGLSNQSRKIRSLTYAGDINSIQLDASDIEAHYLSQSSRYQTPEQVRIDFIELSLENIKDLIELDETAVYERYQVSMDSFTSPESREASHILITLGNDASSEESDQVLAQITRIRQRYDAGEGFSDLARELSQDPGSAEDGGNLGEIEPGVMVQAFESVLFSMQVGQVSEPVKTSFGWHLIQLKGINGGEIRSFDSVKTELADEIRTEQAEGQIYDLAESLANLAYEQSDSLLPAAEQLDLKVETSDWFDRSSGAGIAGESKIRQQAFSADVLQHGLNSEAIELGSDRVVFIRLNQHRPAAARPLDQVADAIETQLIRIKAGEQNLKIGLQALESLIAGSSDLDSLAQSWMVEVSDHGFVSRSETGIDATILNQAFSMARPDQKLVYQGLSVADGGYTIIELSAVISNNTNVDQKAIDNLVRATASAEYQSVVRLLSHRAEVIRTPVEEL